MTYKDCLGFCLGYCNFECTCPKKCRNFIDCSEWVHLPCKEGDTLYEITSRKTISEYKVKALRVELFGIFIDWEITKGFVDKYITNVPVSEIGKTIFLTREEAEEVLEEREKND